MSHYQDQYGQPSSYGSQQSSYASRSSGYGRQSSSTTSSRYYGEQATSQQQPQSYYQAQPQTQPAVDPRSRGHASRDSHSQSTQSSYYGTPAARPAPARPSTSGGSAGLYGQPDNTRFATASATTATPSSRAYGPSAPSSTARGTSSYATSQSYGAGSAAVPSAYSSQPQPSARTSHSHSHGGYSGSTPAAVERYSSSYQPRPQASQSQPQSYQSGTGGGYAQQRSQYRQPQPRQPAYPQSRAPAPARVAAPAPVPAPVAPRQHQHRYERAPVHAPPPVARRQPAPVPPPRPRPVPRARPPAQPPKPFKVVSRWHADVDRSVCMPLFPTTIPYGLPPSALRAFLVRARIDEITKRLTAGGITIDQAEIREPSPEPTFDKLGRRTNSRIQRVKESLAIERSRLVEEAYRINPLYRPPADFKFESRKLIRKLPIPVERFPDYNFIGLIIGPRGSTQKRLEKETGAHIAIRGKGSIKSGSRTAHHGSKKMESEEPLHVLITADDPITLQRAVAVVEKMLTPIEEGMNEFKRRQLRELARIHGTLRDDSGPVGVPEGDGSLLKQLQDTYGKGRGVREDAKLERGGSGGFGDRSRNTMHGHDVDRFDGMDIDDEKLDEQFEQFRKELDGVASSQPWYEYYNIRSEKPVVAPGLEGSVRRGHFLYMQQRRRKGCNAARLRSIQLGRTTTNEDDDDDDGLWSSDDDDLIDRYWEESMFNGSIDDNDEDLLDDGFFDATRDHGALFDQLFPPGTMAEQQYEHFLNTQRLEEEERRKQAAKAQASAPMPVPVPVPAAQDPSELLKKVKKAKKPKAVAGDLPPWMME